MGVTASGQESCHSCSQQARAGRALRAWGQGAEDRPAEPPRTCRRRIRHNRLPRLAPRKTECSRGQGADARASCAMCQPGGSRASGGRKRGMGGGRRTAWPGTEVRFGLC